MPRSDSMCLVQSSGTSLWGHTVHLGAWTEPLCLEGQSSRGRPSSSSRMFWSACCSCIPEGSSARGRCSKPPGRQKKKKEQMFQTVMLKSVNIGFFCFKPLSFSKTLVSHHRLGATYNLSFYKMFSISQNVLIVPVYLVCFILKAILFYLSELFIWKDRIIFQHNISQIIFI